MLSVWHVEDVAAFRSSSRCWNSLAHLRRIPCRVYPDESPVWSLYGFDGLPKKGFFVRLLKSANRIVACRDERVHCESIVFAVLDILKKLEEPAYLISFLFINDRHSPKRFPFFNHTFTIVSASWVCRPRNGVREVAAGRFTNTVDSRFGYTLTGVAQKPTHPPTVCLYWKRCIWVNCRRMSGMLWMWQRRADFG